MEIGVGIGEGVGAGEDITLSLSAPRESLSFRLRNLLIVLMVDRVVPKKLAGAASDACVRNRCLTMLTNRH